MTKGPKKTVSVTMPLEDRADDRPRTLNVRGRVFFVPGQSLLFRRDIFQDFTDITF